MLFDDIIISFAPTFLFDSIGSEFEQKFIKSMQHKPYTALSHKQIKIITNIIIKYHHIIPHINKNDILNPKFAVPPYHAEQEYDISMDYIGRNKFKCQGNCFGYIYKDRLQHKTFSNISSFYEDKESYITIPFFERKNFMLGISKKYNLEMNHITEHHLLNDQPFYNIDVNDDYIKVNSNDDQFNYIFPEILPATEETITKLARFSKLRNINISADVDFSIEETIKTYDRSVVSFKKTEELLHYISHIYDEEKTFMITDCISNTINKKTFFCDMTTISGLRYSHVESCIKDSKHVIIIIQGHDCPYTLKGKTLNQYPVFNSLVTLANKITIFTPSDAEHVYYNTFKKKVLFYKQYIKHFGYNDAITKQELYGLYGIHYIN